LRRAVGVRTRRVVSSMERLGLLPEPVREANGYRRYGADTADRIAFIRNAQAAGLTLAEIRSVLDIRDAGTEPCGHVTGLLMAKQAAVRDQIERLRILDAELRTLIDRSAHLDPADCESDEICHILRSPR